LNELQRTLSDMVKSGLQSNSTMNTIINDYVKYHVILVILGAILVLVFALLSLMFWTKFKRIPKISKFKWGFEKKVYFYFGTLSIMIALLMTLISVANASNVLNPLHGFSLFVGQYSTAKVANMDKLHQTFNQWINSGNENIPFIIQEQINKCAKFHTTKAIVCGILLIIFVALSITLWATLIKRTKVNDSKWSFKEKAYFVFGIVTGVLSLLMMVIVVANMQGAFAPLAAFLVGFLR